MGLNHPGKFLLRFQTFPLQRSTPVVEKSSSPAFFLEGPNLTERFFEKVSRVQSLMALSDFFKAPRPSSVRFSRRESNVYFCPLSNCCFFILTIYNILVSGFYPNSQHG